jgi:hypothetical protein
MRVIAWPSPITSFTISISFSVLHPKIGFLSLDFIKAILKPT